MNTRSVFKAVVCVGLMSLASAGLAAEGVWTRKADMPTPRMWPSTGAVDGKICAIGGAQWIQGTYLSTVEVYDPATDTWARKTDMPTARNGHAAAVVNGRIYVIGGEPSPQASLATVEEYDPATDTWKRKADMPTKRTFLCACALDGKVYAFGGVTAGVTGAVWNPSTLEVYDPVTDTWATRASMPTATCVAGACVLNGKMYVMGGVPGGLVHDPPVSTVQEYDPATDTWTSKANMPTARACLSVSAVGRRVYAIGGGTFGGATFSTVEEYDPASDSWMTMPDMPAARLYLSTAVVNGRIYAIGGAREFYPGSGLSTTEEYDPNPLVVDFNGDGNVDAEDMAILVANWGKDEPLCDIGPVPWGDGIVDEKDLAVLMEFLVTPGPKALDVSRDVVLSWLSPSFAKTYDVYLGTSGEAVTDANRANPLDTLVSLEQAETMYDPDGPLEFGQTYYWRVDFVSAHPAPIIYTGPVLSFTTEAFAYPIKNVVATASSSQSGMGPEKTVDGSGLDKNDGHSTTATHMWVSGRIAGPHWIQFEFDKVCALHELWVWNSNQTIEPIAGLGAREVTIEYSVDGVTWTPLADVPEFAQAPGEAAYVHNTAVSFGGVQAKFVKLNIVKNWGGKLPQTGLSEVRFLYIPSATPAQP